MAGSGGTGHWRVQRSTPSEMAPEFGEMTPARRANAFMARFERVSHLGESGSFFDGSSQFLRALLSPRQGEGRTCGLLNLQRRTVLFGVQSSKVENIPYLAIKRFLVPRA